MESVPPPSPIASVAESNVSSVMELLTLPCPREHVAYQRIDEILAGEFECKMQFIDAYDENATGEELSDEALHRLEVCQRALSFLGSLRFPLNSDFTIILPTAAYEVELPEFYQATCFIQREFRVLYVTAESPLVARGLYGPAHLVIRVHSDLPLSGQAIKSWLNRVHGCFGARVYNGHCLVS